MSDRYSKGKKPKKPVIRVSCERPINAVKNEEIKVASGDELTARDRYAVNHDNSKDNSQSSEYRDEVLNIDLNPLTHRDMNQGQQNLKLPPIKVIPQDEKDEIIVLPEESDSSRSDSPHLPSDRQFKEDSMVRFLSDQMNSEEVARDQNHSEHNKRISENIESQVRIDESEGVTEGEKMDDECGFDGLMHLQTLDLQAAGNRKLFSCRKDPCIQVISGLKDPDVILTVSLKVIEHMEQEDARKSTKFDFEHDDFEKTMSLKQQLKELKSSLMEKKINEKKAMHVRRQIRGSLEFDEIAEKLKKQYMNQNKLPEKYIFKITKENSKHWHDYDEENKRGKALTPYPEHLQKLEDNIEGQWTIAYRNRRTEKQVELICIIDKNGNITENNSADDVDNIQGSKLETHMHQRYFQLMLKGELHKLQADESFQKMDYPVGVSPPANIQIIKFEKRADPSRHKGCKVHAIIKLWRIIEKEHRLKNVSTYHFCEPLVTKVDEEEDDKQALKKVIHTTIDGEAFLFQQKHKEKPIMFIIDQKWPMHEGLLPIDIDMSEKLNKKQNVDKTKLKISEFLQGKDFKPQNKIQAQMQYFNSFKYLVQTSEFYCKILSLENYVLRLHSQRLEGYNCIMLLSIDENTKCCYILGKLNKDRKSMPFKGKKLRKLNNKSIFNISYDRNPAQKRNDDIFAIIEYKLDEESTKAYQIQQDQVDEHQHLKKTANQYLSEARQYKYEILCHHEKTERENTFILEIQPVQAVLVLRLKKIEIIDARQQSIKPKKEYRAEQFKQIDCLKNLKVIKQVNQKTGQNTYWSMSKPTTSEDHQQPAINFSLHLQKSTIKLTDLLTGHQMIKELKIGANYFKNKIQSHAATLTKCDRLIFGTIELQPGSSFKGISLTVDSEKNQSDFMSVDLSRNASVMPGQTLAKQQKHIECHDTSHKQIHDYTIEYPVIVYIEDENSKISLCNLLQPDKPQQQVQFKNYMIKNFVGGSNMFARHQTALLDTNIAMLVAKIDDPDKYWLMVLSFFPYKENILQDAQVNIAMGGNLQYPKKYKRSRIKCAELITQVNIQSDMSKMIQQTVILQYSDGIYKCDLYDESLLFWQSNEEDDEDLCVKMNTNKIIQLKMIRGYNQNLYFAEKDSSNRTEIINIYQETPEEESFQLESQDQQIKKQSIYKLPGVEVLALEIDTSNVQDDRFGEVRNSLFIIDSLLKIHHLQKLPGQKEYQSRTFNLPHHDLGHMSMIRWNSVPMCQKLLQYDGVNYSMKTGCQWDLKSLVGYQNDEWKYLTSQITTDSQLNVSLYVNYEIGAFNFVVRPAQFSKRLMLTSILSSKDLDQMVFVTNEHILASMYQYYHKSESKQKIWNVFNIRNDTIVLQKYEDNEPWSIINKNNSSFELACTDFSNIYESEERIIVMRNCIDQNDDIYVLRFDEAGQLQKVLTLEKQKFIMAEKKQNWPLQSFRLDNQIEVEKKPEEPRIGTIMKRDSGTTNSSNLATVVPMPFCSKTSVQSTASIYNLHKMQKTRFYPGCAYQQPRNLSFERKDFVVSANQRYMDEQDHNSSQAIIKIQKGAIVSENEGEEFEQNEAQDAFKQQIVVAATVFFKLKNEFQQTTFGVQQSLVIQVDCGDDLQGLMTPLCKYELEIKKDRQNYEESIHIPHTEKSYLVFTVKQEAIFRQTLSAEVAILTRIHLHVENDRIPMSIRKALIEKEERYTTDLESWKRQVWRLDPEKLGNEQDFCLPTLYKLPPLIYFKKRLVITLGELDQSKLPHIHWNDQPRKSITQTKMNSKVDKSEEIGMIVQEKYVVIKKSSKSYGNMQDQPIGENIVERWTHINLVMYSKKNGHNKTILPGKAALIGDIIYLSDVHGAFQDMMRIRICEDTLNDQDTTDLDSDLQKPQYKKWSFKLNKGCPEFNRCGERNTPISIDRLKNSWITKLNTKRIPDRRKTSSICFRENYKDVLQVNFVEQAVLFAITDENQSQNAISDVFAEELDQMEYLEDFVKNYDDFIPIGYVPTYFSKEIQHNAGFKLQKTTVLTNENENYYLVQKEYFNNETLAHESTKFSGPYIMYTEYDLQNIRYMQDQIKLSQKPSVDVDTLARMYSGQNIFSLFFNDHPMLKFLAKWFEKTNMNEEQSRSIARILSANLVTPIDRSRSFVCTLKPLDTVVHLHKKSIFKWSYKQHQHDKEDMSKERELLLQIALVLPEFQMDNIIDCLDDLIELVVKDTPVSREILNHATFQTIHSKKVTEMNWNKSKLGIEAWKSDTTFIDSVENRLDTYDQIADISKPERRQIVNLRLVSLRWMFQDGMHFCDLASEFMQLDRPSWFCNDLMIALFKTNWVDSRIYIVYHGFIPFILYFLASFIYTERIANIEMGEFQSGLGWLEIALYGIPFFAGWLYFSIMEACQFGGAWLDQPSENMTCWERFKNAMRSHYSRSWNVLDTVLVLIVPLILIATIAQRSESPIVPPEWVMWMTLFCQLAMWFKLFDWLRLLSKTAIYPILLYEVLIDIWPFILTMVIVLCLFGNFLYILNGLVVYQGEPALFPKLMPLKVASSFMTNILTMTGESQYDTYYIRSMPMMTTLIWLQFIATILMTQIVFLNILIAIISDTFDRVWDQRQQYVLSSQASIIQDWLTVIPAKVSSHKDLYMYIVKPTHLHDADNWNGRIQQIKKVLDEKCSLILKQANEQNRQLKDQREENFLHQENQRHEAQLTKDILQSMQSQLTSIQQNHHSISQQQNNPEGILKRQSTQAAVKKLATRRMQSDGRRQSIPLNNGRQQIVSLFNQLSTTADQPDALDFMKTKVVELEKKLEQTHETQEDQGLLMASLLENQNKLAERMDTLISKLNEKKQSVPRLDASRRDQQNQQRIEEQKQKEAAKKKQISYQPAASMPDLKNIQSRFMNFSNKPSPTAKQNPVQQTPRQNPAQQLVRQSTTKQRPVSAKPVISIKKCE